MEMIAHGGKPTHLKGGGAPPPVKVAKDFVQADKGKKKFSPGKEAAKVKALRGPPKDAGGISGDGAVGGV